MAVIWRALIVAGGLWLGAVLSGGVAAQEPGIPGDILRDIAAAGRAAERAEATATTRPMEAWEMTRFAGDTATTTSLEAVAMTGSPATREPTGPTAVRAMM